MDISLEHILTEENIQEAITKVESRKGVGEDGAGIKRKPALVRRWFFV